LTLGDWPTPEPGPGEALVRLKVAALNRVDLWVREGWPGLRLRLPHVLGADGAGEIAAVGEGVTEWTLGERVVINPNLGCWACDACLSGRDNLCRNWQLLGETIPGTYAEYVSVPVQNLLRLPDTVTEAEAAAAALVFLTAWHSLIRRGRLRAGESVLVVGASGGVNTASIQIARLAGARVYVIGSNAEKLALAAELGAEELIDRSQAEDWSREVFQRSGRRGMDVVVDNVGSTLPLSFRAARRGGRILTVGNTDGPRVEIDNRYVFGKHLSLIGSTMGTRQDFLEVMALVFSGALRAVIDCTYPFEESRQAHERLAAGDQLGKLLLDLS
jgi:NADPH:quinone reductase-like Zn-dependent oxidoreductase